jgi:hypothetical protein
LDIGRGIPRCVWRGGDAKFPNDILRSLKCLHLHLTNVLSAENNFLTGR